MSLESPTTEEILNLDLAELEQILEEVYQKKPEELIKLEEEVKKADPAVMAEMQKQKPPPREFESAPRWWSRNQQDCFDKMINALKVDEVWDCHE